jgi:hypothetical protein
MEFFETSAFIRSLEGKEDTVRVLEENGANDVIVEYKGEKCHAIFNVFNGHYYVDDLWKIEPAPSEVKLPTNPPTNEERKSKFLDKADTEAMYAIYQLKSGDDLRDLRFTRLDTLKRLGYRVERKNYDLVYAASMTDDVKLDDIYTKFNIDRPADFTGHSLSISDVVVYKQIDGRYSAFYVDSYDFALQRDFMSDSERSPRKKSDMEM